MSVQRLRAGHPGGSQPDVGTQQPSDPGSQLPRHIGIDWSTLREQPLINPSTLAFTSVA